MPKNIRADPIRNVEQIYILWRMFGEYGRLLRQVLLRL